MARLLADRAVRTYQEIRDRKRVAIAAIDFGTTFCSLAYTLPHEDTVNFVELNKYQQRTRVPTAILLQKQTVAGGTQELMMIRDFGFEAQSQTSTLLNEERPDHIYFELVKMLLYNDKNNESGTTINLPVKSLSGEQYYLVEVIAYVLKHLKNCLMEWLQIAAPRLRTADIHWVITVPAIWKQDGKQMMREAAYKAGLFNDEEGITHFTPYGTPIQRSPDAAHTDQLSLALEPECVALYCQQLPTDCIAEYADKNVADAKSCMVLDIGGGTVDITALKQVSPGSYEVIISPTGNEFGGKEVNERFRWFLQKIVRDEGFQSFLKNQSTHEEHNAILQKIIYHDFEKLKVNFGSKVDYLIPEGRGRAETQPVPETQANKQVPVLRKRSCTSPENFRFRLELPEAFRNFYKNIDQEIIKKHGGKLGVENSRRLLMFSDSMMMKCFFEPVLIGIGCPVIRAVNEAKKSGPLSVIYMAGGFGGCKFVYQYLKDKIKLLLRGANVPLIVPTDHTLAVCRGAVLYGRNPGAITIREMEASYGIRVSKLFQKGVHEERHAYGDQDGTKRCGNIFRPFVVQGERVKANDVFTIKLVPQFHTDTEAKIGFYCSTNPNVQYTKDAGTSQIGEIKLSIPNTTDQPVTERIIEITMNFSSTEIKATARALYLNDRPPVSAVLDFLN